LPPSGTQHACISCIDWQKANPNRLHTWRGLELSHQGVSKHLKVLERAGLVRAHRAGRERRYVCAPEAMREANAYLDEVSVDYAYNSRRAEGLRPRATRRRHSLYDRQELRLEEDSVDACAKRTRAAGILRSRAQRHASAVEPHIRARDGFRINAAGRSRWLSADHHRQRGAEILGLRELTGIPRALTIADLLRVECADNGIDVVAVESLMKMGTRDGVTPFIHRNQLLESGEYIVGIAHTGTHDAAAGGRNRAGGSHEAKPGFLVNLLPRTATNYERHRPENAGSEPPSASSRARNCG
jgi:DNA-binding transcriptional ArsR family regulator